MNELEKELLRLQLAQNMVTLGANVVVSLLELQKTALVQQQLQSPSSGSVATNLLAIAKVLPK